MEPKLQDIFDTIRIPLVSGVQRQAAPSSFLGSEDQWSINCFMQTSTNVVTGEKETWVVKRPGIEKNTEDIAGILGAVDSICCANIVITSLNDVNIAAIYDASNAKYVIVQYRPLTLTALKIGEITGVLNGLGQIFLTELTIANVATVGVIWNSNDGVTSKGYYATSAAGLFTVASLTEITDTDFPPKQVSPLPLVGGMVQMNGTTYVMTNTGAIANSDLNSISSWNSLGLVQAISYPDQGVGLLRYKNYILAFGEDSIEWMADVGNPPPKSPLQRQEQGFIKFGCVHAKGMITVDDSVFWLGKSSTGTCGFWRMEGFTPVKISSSVEDQQIDYASAQSGQYGTHTLSCISVLGQKQIIIGGVNVRAGLLYSSTAINGNDPHNLNNNDGTGILTYNIEEKSYWGWRQQGYQSVNAFPMGTSQFQLNNTSANRQFFLMNSDAPAANLASYIYQYNIDSYYWTDTLSTGAKSYYPVVFQLNRWTVGNMKGKRIHKLKLVCDTFYSNPLEEETGATLWFLWANDSWEPSTGVASARGISIPKSNGRYYVANLGKSRTWALGFASKNAMAMRIRYVEIDLSQGTN